MTKIDIYSGFLGAGKTTLIKKMIAEAYAGEKIVLIENEFGQVAIDGSFLRQTGVEITEMNSGCICCSLVGDFGKALQKVMDEFSPDRILIEPSGVGKLSDVIAAVRRVSGEGVQLGCAITVADATKCGMYLKNFGEFYSNQLEHAGLILLSRTDIAPAEKIQTAAARIRQCNPKATIVTTPWDQLTGEKILEAMERKSSLMDELGNLEQQAKGHHQAHDVFTSWGMETAKVYSEVELAAICKDLARSARFGTVLRAKGYVAGEGGIWLQFDYVPGEAEVRTAAPDVTGRLCVIGSGLRKDAIAALFGV